MDRWIEYAAHKLPLPPSASSAEREKHRRAMLARVLNMDTVVAVIGSGCTIPMNYPTWRQFALGMVEEAIGILESAGAMEEARRFQGFRKKLRKVAAKPSGESLMFYISACQNVVDRVPELKEKWQSACSSYFRKTFGGSNRREPARNPLEVLLELPIYRFITTNYDCEVERALEKKRRVSWERFGIGRSAGLAADLSFTQATGFAEQLARFTLARTSENQNMVFHCHGRFDDVDSIIASEADYQKWYVSDADGPRRAFQQTIEILLGSNPLLFVGYGMADYDLLRPLRHLGALDPKRKEARPVFGLLCMKDRDEDVHFQEALFERYGLHVIPFYQEKGEDECAALCRTLRGLGNELERSRDDWFDKPCVRALPAPPRKPAPCLIPDFVGHTTPELVDPIPVKDQVQEIHDAIQKGAKVVCVVGPGGTGKTWNLLQLLEKARGAEEFDGYFYWNAHYTYEAFTVLEQAVRYLDPEGRGRGTRRNRLLQALAHGHHLVIMDGCERLLRLGDGRGGQKAYGAGFRQLLSTLAEALEKGGPFESVIVLSGRHVPGELDKRDLLEKKKIAVISASRVQAQELKGATAFQGFEDSVSELCSLLNGHSYALLLASRLLRRRAGTVSDLRRALAGQPPKKRFRTMVELMFEDLGRRRERLGEKLLERLSFFLEPVSRATVEVCFAEARQALGPGAKDADLAQVDKILEDLASDGLLLAISRPDKGTAHVVHASIRNHFGRRERLSRANIFPDFALSCYTSGTNGVDPGSKERLDEMRRLFARLCEAAKSAERAVAADLCRDAYGALRSQLECSAVARFPTFDRYMRDGIALASLAKGIAARHWKFCDPGDIESIEEEHGPLFIAELAWLYNDVGLALFLEGLLSDAFAVWEQGYEINRALESTHPYGEFVLESLLNLTHALIEIGQVSAAMEYLEEAERLNGYLGDLETGSRILGFKGFCEHIRGNLRRADELYERALAQLREGANRRATSFFRTLQAGVRVELGKVAEARSLARESRALAEAGDYPDLVAYARIAEADVLVKSDPPMLAEARQGYERVLRESQELGARGIEAFAKLKLAALSFEQGDAEGARRLAMQSLRLSNELGLGLMTTRALIVLARATVLSGQRDLGIGYLKLAREQARVQQYGLRLRDAERHLQDYGVED